MHPVQQVRFRVPTRGDPGQGLRTAASGRGAGGIQSTDYRAAEFKGWKYTIQVAPEVCTGCNLCVMVCPAKDKSNPRHKAINMKPLLEPANRDGAAARTEDRAVEVVRSVKESVSVPVTVKLSPFYTSLAHFAGRLDRLGIDGLLLFNRFYQPDLDIEALEVRRVVHLSDSSELLLRLRWLAILFGRMKTPLAVTGGVHSAEDAVKAVMAGAAAVQTVSALLRRGPGFLKVLREDLARWLEEHEYESLRQMLGSLSLSRVPDPSAYERANYVKILQTWEHPAS
jgi:dihydroorotate dehydrogenase (fumarate)